MRINLLLSIFSSIVGMALLLLPPHACQAQTVPVLSDSARISLITVAPGEELYSTFGHSALRVRDPLNRLDRCYNYGTFDFSQPDFYTKFLRGKLLYFLDLESYRNFEYGNLYDRRSMREQWLNLDAAQRQRLFNLLQENALPQNRTYKYDFFYDNCATRIRDIVAETFYHQIVFDSSGIPADKTMRQLLHPYLENKPWTRFGIDLILGVPADRRALAEDYMFLPDYMYAMFGTTRLNAETPLVERETQITAPGAGAPAQPGPLDHPILVTSLIALIGLLSMSNPRAEAIFDALFWLLLGIMGLIMTLLWFATDHSATKVNLNVFWALPSHLFYFWRSRRSEWVENYFLGAAMLAALALLFWYWMPQQMPLEAIPLAGLVVVKGVWRLLRPRTPSLRSE